MSHKVQPLEQRCLDLSHDIQCFVRDCNDHGIYFGRMSKTIWNLMFPRVFNVIANHFEHESV